MSRISRRTFLQTSSLGASAVALGAMSTARAYAANETSQIGWIGVGGRGSSLLQTMVENCPNARTAAVCDLVPQRVDHARKIAERDKPNGYTDFREMLEKEKLDGVLVATEPSNHAKVVVPVLEGGLHCFAEKPMDTTVERIDAITAAARKSRGVYQIGTQRRYHPGYLGAMKVIHSGEIGRIIVMQGHYHWTWEVGGMSVPVQGGELIEQASHHMDVMSWAMGNQAPVTCVSMGYNLFAKDPNTLTETHSVTTFQFPTGVLFSYSHFFYLPPHFEDEKVWVICEKAGIDLNSGMLHGRGTREHPEGPERRVGMASGRDWGLGTAEGLQSFVAGIRSGWKEKPNSV